MRYLKLCLFFLLFAAFGCSDATNELPIPELSSNDLAKYKMKILPEVPAAAQEVKLVLYEECKYNKLAGVTKTGNTIAVERQFNSMIMAPCVLTNDTISLGKLAAGSYRVDYKLVDIAYQPKGKTTVAVSFRLDVLK